MSLATDYLSFFRAQWATRFTDECVVKERTAFVLNNTTGKNEPVYASRYTGGCLVRPASKADAVYGEQLDVVFDHLVFLPFDADPLSVNFLVDITSATDARLTGKQFIIRGIPLDTYVTHRILLCEDNQGA